MMILQYAGGQITISDEACEALLTYAGALARSSDSDTVSLPVMGSDGELAVADILIGPASQLIAFPSKQEAREFDDASGIAYMKSKTALLRPAHPIPAATASAAPDDDVPGELFDEL